MSYTWRCETNPKLTKVPAAVTSTTMYATYFLSAGAYSLDKSFGIRINNSAYSGGASIQVIHLSESTSAVKFPRYN